MHLINIRPSVTPVRLIIFSIAFIVLFDNSALLGRLFSILPLQTDAMAFFLSFIVWLFAIQISLVLLFSFRVIIKPILIVILLLSSITAYFMNNYGVIIDDNMINNMLQTDMHESLGLLNINVFAYVIFLGVLPSLLVSRAKLIERPWRQELLNRIYCIGLFLIIAICIMFIFASWFASLREHREFKYYINPTYAVISAIKVMNAHLLDLENTEFVISSVGTDAFIPDSDTDRELIIMVIGETVRSNRFSLNGYKKETNPLLEKENVVSFRNVKSCGTATAISVPCIFSSLNKTDFSNEKAVSQENLLDIAQRVGVHILWRDNNSSSKGVATRVSYEDFKTRKNNPVCDSECRDEGMLNGLQTYIDSQASGDVMIVLHQMGNHGPEYYKRYPQSFEHFTPVCQTNQLALCSQLEIDNAYDNAIYYTDYFLSKVIALLKQNDPKFEAALFYVGDHGESLGEHGLYLHGLPYLIAPDEQIDIPMITWFSDSFKVNKARLSETKYSPYSHDNVFHSILGLLEIKSKVYNKEKDLFH